MTAVSRDVPVGGRRDAQRGVSVRTRPESVSESRVLAALLGACLVIVVLIGLAPDRMPAVSLLIPLVLASIFLGPRTLPWLATVVLLAQPVSLSLQSTVTSRQVGATAVQVVITLIVLASNRRRAQLGVAGSRGETMFIDLRDRILTQSAIPELPADWLVESALASSGGTPFAGDFVVAAQPAGSDRLSLVLVDVSGKGADAGNRALLLSGAMSGLIGVLPPRDFLPAANSYLVEHAWDEGFATAVHLSLDLGTGEYEIRCAGHPPAVQRSASSGRWSVLANEGTVLGLLPETSFEVTRGRLARGDALMLYTDGIVEDASRDIDLGIDRMLGRAEASLRGQFEGGAERLLAELGSSDDDRALVVVHRR